MAEFKSPHLPVYHEAVGYRYGFEFQRFSRLTAAIVPKNTELWPELDNLPHTTFSKYHDFARFEIETALSLGSEKITINIFDMIGNGINEPQKNHEYLSEEEVESLFAENFLLLDGDGVTTLAGNKPFKTEKS